MKAEARVNTTVTVDLGDFTSRDLIDEIEGRGHAVDADCAFDLETPALLKELARRAFTIDYDELPLDVILQALKDYGCPDALTKQLEDWINQPVPTPLRLEEWLANCP